MATKGDVDVGYNPEKTNANTSGNLPPKKTVDPKIGASAVPVGW
jgi:hypothetical protein